MSEFLYVRGLVSGLEVGIASAWRNSSLVSIYMHHNNNMHTTTRRVLASMHTLASRTVYAFCAYVILISTVCTDMSCN